MRRQAVIVDTNVVVAGLLTGSVESTVARILGRDPAQLRGYLRKEIP